MTAIFVGLITIGGTVAGIVAGGRCFRDGFEAGREYERVIQQIRDGRTS